MRTTKAGPCGRPNRAGQRLSWLVAGALGPSVTGMGSVDWRICISCVKLRLIEPRRSPGMTIAAVETLETGRVCATVCSQTARQPDSQTTSQVDEHVMSIEGEIGTTVEERKGGSFFNIETSFWL